MPKAQAPVKTATPEEELPKTAVRPSQKDMLLQQMTEKLAEYENSSPSTSSENIENIASDEETSFKKRYGDLRRHAQQKENEFGKEITELRSQIMQLTQAQNQPLPKTREEFEAWKAKYPDIVGFIEIIAEERASAAKAELSEELTTVKTKLSETEKQKAYATLKVMVPDLEQIIGSTSYVKWFNDQPMFIQEILDTSDDPHKIAYYMNIYKSSLTPAVPANKADKLKALETSVKNTGVTPSANGGKWKYTQSQIAKMSTQEYVQKEDDIIAARNSGQILDDLSKHNSVFD